MMKRIMIVLMACLVTASYLSAKDVKVTMKNGDILNGECEGVAGSTLYCYRENMPKEIKIEMIKKVQDAKTGKEIDMKNISKVSNESSIDRLHIAPLGIKPLSLTEAAKSETATATAKPHKLFIFSWPDKWRIPGTQ
jgi:hypothetical protein